MKRIILAFTLTAISSVAFAQAPQQASISELQDYVRVLQSDRQNAQSQIDQLRINLLAAQERAQEVDAYWRSYVAGLTPKPEK